MRKTVLSRLLPGRRVGFALLTLGTALALFYAEENWRGARAWAGCRRELLARGELLTPSEMAPRPVPDDENLACSPLLRALVDQAGGQPSAPVGLIALKLPRLEGQTMPMRGGQPANDLSAWAEHLSRIPGNASAVGADPIPARMILAALEPMAAELDELARDARMRPRSRFPLPYGEAGSPPLRLASNHPIVIFQAVQVLTLRARALLANGEPAAARADVLLGVRLAEAVADEPLLLSQMTRVASLSTLLQPLREGLAERRWTAGDLETLEGNLLGVNLLEGWLQAMRGERALIVLPVLDSLRHGGRGAWEEMFWGSRGWSWAAPLMPAGWLDANKASASRHLQAALDPVDPAHHRVHLDAASAGTVTFPRAMRWGPSNFLVRASFRYITFNLDLTLETQRQIDQARVACALERRFLARGDYPAELTALVSEGVLPRLPPDLLDGGPPRYRRTPAGRYVLSAADPENRFRGEAWVWGYPEVAASP